MGDAEMLGEVGLRAFTPSRKRNINSVLEMAASGSQPQGAAPPSLIPGEPADKDEHIVAASGVNPLARLQLRR